MPVIYDITKDLRFKEGKLEEARATVIRLLKKGELSITMIAEILDRPLIFVLQIQKELKKNPNLK